MIGFSRRAKPKYDKIESFIKSYFTEKSFQDGAFLLHYTKFLIEKGKLEVEGGSPPPSGGSGPPPSGKSGYPPPEIKFAKGGAPPDASADGPPSDASADGQGSSGGPPPPINVPPHLEAMKKLYISFLFSKDETFDINVVCKDLKMDLICKDDKAVEIFEEWPTALKNADSNAKGIEKFCGSQTKVNSHE